jgi:hypothetical protein
LWIFEESLVRVVALGIAGLVAGGLVVGSAAPALAKGNLALTVDHPTVRAGQPIRFRGVIMDDAGVPPALRFCLQEQVAGRWVQIKSCLTHGRKGFFSQVFVDVVSPVHLGRHLFRGIVLDAVGHRHYTASPLVAITVR